MQPNFAQIIDSARSVYLGAPQSVFSDDHMLKAAKLVVDELTTVFRHHQIPQVLLISSPTTIAAGTTELNPADESIDNFGDIYMLEERPADSSGDFEEMFRVDVLPQREQTSTLSQFTIRQGKIQFVGATQDVQIRIHYYASGAAQELEQEAQIAVDDSLNFLAAATAAKAGPSKGYTTEASEARAQAYGPGRNPLSELGGYLQQLVETQLRTLQQTPVQPKMYSAGRGW